MRPFVIFVAVYLALADAYRNGYESGKTLYFLIDANPFRWQGEVSMDPALFYDFNNDMNRKFIDGCHSAEEARLFCRNWLALEMKREEVYRGNLLEAFDAFATEQAWPSIVEEAKETLYRKEEAIKQGGLA